MDNYFAYYFSVASIFVAALQFLNKNNWIHFAYLLFGCGAVALFMSSSILEKHTEFAASIVLLFVIGFALGSLKKGKEIYKQMVLTALCTLPLLISWSKTISIQDYTMNISAIHLGLIIFGSLIYYLSSLKYAVFTFVFKQTDPQLSHFTFQIILAGLGVYIGSFFASYFGVFLVGSGATVSAFLYKDYRISILLMGYFLFGSFITLNHIETLDFSLGKMFFGFILGVFFILLPNALNSVEQKRVLKFILPILLQIMLSILLIWLGTQKTDLGGFDAYLAVLFGIVATQLFVGTVNVNLLVLVLFLSIGLHLSSLLKSNVTTEAQTLSLPETIKSDGGEEKKESEPFDLPGKKLNEVIGNYKIDETTSELTFQLGPKGGITKGAIKQFSGRIKLGSGLKKVQFNVVLPVSKLTTFNAYRDESLMEDSYFNVAKFPKMSYVANEMIEKDDYYIITGNFEMLGKKQRVDVRIKYVGQNEKGTPIIIGKSSLDRTLFGMQPDPKEGNVVDFQFKIELLEIK